MRSVLADKVQVQQLERETFVQSFSEELIHQQSFESVDIESNEVFQNVWLSWNSESLNHVLSYLFFDSPNVNHPLIRRMAEQWLAQLVGVNDGHVLVDRVHDKFLSFCDSSSLNARTLMNIEWSLIQYIAKEKGIFLGDIRSYESINLFNQYESGIAWLDVDGWWSLPMGETDSRSLNLNLMKHIEFMGDSTVRVQPNGQRMDQHFLVINSEHGKVLDYIKSLFSDVLVGLSISDIVDTVHKGVQSFDYISEAVHEWQSLDTIFERGGGDCEDLAHLEVSLLARAFKDAGYVDEANSLSVISGYIGLNDRQVGHTVIQFDHQGKSYVLDSTLQDGLVLKSAYASIFGWQDVSKYSETSNLFNLRQAAMFDTSFASDDINDWGQFETEFLTALDLFEKDNDEESDGYFANAYNYFRSVTDTGTADYTYTDDTGTTQTLTGSDGVTSIYFSGYDYYNYAPVAPETLYITNEGINSQVISYGDTTDYWLAENTFYDGATYASYEAAQAQYRLDKSKSIDSSYDFWATEYDVSSTDEDIDEIGMTTADADALISEDWDGSETLLFGNPTYYLDAPFSSHLGGLQSAMESVNNQRTEMSDHLTSEYLSKYLGQNYSGYFVYDYSRIMRDYQEIMDLSQVITCYLTAFTSIANTCNWVASQLSYDNEPNPNVKSRQRMIKSVQSAVFKFLDELEYFIPLFLETYDDLNSAIYADYTQDIQNQFNSIESALVDMFQFGTETGKKNYWLEKAHAEYFATVATNRKLVQQADVYLPHSMAFSNYMNPSGFLNEDTDLYSVTTESNPVNFVNLLRQIEYDITNDVYYQVPNTDGETDDDGEEYYLSPLHYYFPWYFGDSDLLLYESDGTTNATSTSGGAALYTSQEILLTDVDFYTASVYSSVGYDTVEIGDDAYSYYDWINNLSGNIFTGDKDTYISPTEDSVNLFSNSDININNDNYKTSEVYQFLHSQAMGFNELFETEVYVDGSGEDTYFGSTLTFPDETTFASGDGVLWDDYQDTYVHYLERKRRLHPNDFVDLMEYYSAGDDDDDGSPLYYDDSSEYANSSTSLELFNALKDEDLIDDYGVFTSEFAEIIASTNTDSIITTLEGDDDYSSSFSSLNYPDYYYNAETVGYNATDFNSNGVEDTSETDVSKSLISQRIADIFALDEWMVEQIDYDYTQPMLDVTMPDNGEISYQDFSYITIFGEDTINDSENTDFTDYEYLRDDMGGTTTGFDSFESASISAAEAGANSEADGSPYVYWGEYIYEDDTAAGDDDPLSPLYYNSTYSGNDAYGFTDDVVYDGGDGRFDSAVFGEDEGQYAYEYYYDAHLGYSYDFDDPTDIDDTSGDAEPLFDWTVITDSSSTDLVDDYLSYSDYTSTYTTKDSLFVSYKLDSEIPGYASPTGTTFIPVYSYENFVVSSYQDDDDGDNDDGNDDANYHDSLIDLFDDEFSAASPSSTTTKADNDFDSDLAGNMYYDFTYYFESAGKDTDGNYLLQVSDDDAGNHNGYYIDVDGIVTNATTYDDYASAYALATHKLTPEDFYHPMSLESGLNIYNGVDDGYYYYYDDSNAKVYVEDGGVVADDYDEEDFETAATNIVSDYWGTVVTETVLNLFRDNITNLPHYDDDYFDHDYIDDNHLNMYKFRSDNSFDNEELTDIYPSFATYGDALVYNDQDFFTGDASMGGQMIITENQMQDFYIQGNAVSAAISATEVADLDDYTSDEGDYTTSTSVLADFPSGYQNAYYDTSIIDATNQQNSAYTKFSAPTGNAWQLSDFYGQAATYEDTYTKIVEFTEGAANTGTITTVSPSGSLDWDEDYGVSNKLPLDERVLSLDTNDSDDYENYNRVGPITLNEFYFIDYDSLIDAVGTWGDSGYDLDGDGLVDVDGSDNLDGALEYWRDNVADLSGNPFQTGSDTITVIIDDVESEYGTNDAGTAGLGEALTAVTDAEATAYRYVNSLERELTPVSSYTDESKVYTGDELYAFLDDSSLSQDEFIDWLEDNFIIESSFRRNRSDSDEFGQVYIRYGYRILEDFETLSDTAVISNFTSNVTNSTDADLSTFVDNIDSDLLDSWESDSVNDLVEYWGVVKGDALDNPGQFLRQVGQEVDSGDIYGLGDIPFLAYEWEDLKVAHNGMMSTHNRVRIFFFIMQSYISALQTATQKIDGLATSGVDPIEATLQLYEKRIGKQQERYRQLVSKTNQLVQVNNAYYRQKIQSMKDGDIGLKIAQATNLYGGLASIALYVTYLMASFYMEASCATALTNPGSAWWCGFWTGLASVTYASFLALAIISNMANVTEMALRSAQEWGTPQMVDTDLLSFDTSDSSGDTETFKNLIQYKRPFSLADFQTAVGSAWENSWNLTTTHSDFANFFSNWKEGGLQGLVYKADDLGNDEWKAASTMSTDGYGDCEDFAALAATIIYDDIKSGSAGFVQGTYSNVDTDNVFLVSGILGAADVATTGNLSFTPTGHTVVMLNANDDDALLTDYLGSGLTVSEFIEDFTKDDNPKYTLDDTREIIVVDLLTDSEMNLVEYHEAYGYFRPKFYQSAPNGDITLAGGTELWDLFAWESSADYSDVDTESPFGEITAPPQPKGPMDLGPYPLGDYTYEFDQTSSRNTILAITYDGTTTYETLDDRIEYGEETYTYDGTSINLDGNYNIDYQGQSASSFSEGSDLSGTLNDTTSVFDAFGRTLDDTLSYSQAEGDTDVQYDYDAVTQSQVLYVSDAVIPSQSSSMSMSSNSFLSDSGEYQFFEMQEILKLEFEEHALLLDMWALGYDSDNFITASHDNATDYPYEIIDWPYFQEIQHRIFIVQNKMKQLFLVMKLKSEFLAIIGARLNEGDTKSVSSAMDSIFNSHFTQVSDTVQTLQSVMNTMQSNYQSNYQIQNQRIDSTFSQYGQIAIETIMSVLLAIPKVGQPIEGFARPFATLFNKVIKFFGNEYNPYYLMDVDSLRGESAAAVSQNDDSAATLTNLESLLTTYGGVDDDQAESYSQLQGLFYTNGTKIPTSQSHYDSFLAAFSEDDDGGKDDWTTMLEAYNDGDGGLELYEIVQSFWVDGKYGYDGIVGGPTNTQAVYEGWIAEGDDVDDPAFIVPDGATRSGDNMTEYTMESEMLRAMSRRYFSESGDDLMFLNDHIYHMSGEKEFSDDDFLDWMQERVSAEVLAQLYYSMYTSSLKSLTANLGLSQTGGNDAMEVSTSMTADIGQHFFDLHSTLMNWELALITVNGSRFSQYKQLDQIILEGVMTVGVALLGALTGGVATKLTKEGGKMRARLMVVFTIFMETAQMGLEMASMIYAAIDAKEENRAMQVLEEDEEDEDDVVDEDEDGTGLGKAKGLVGMAEAQEKQLRKEQNQLGQSTINTAGHSTFGMQSTYVDQSAKIKMKRKMKEMFKTLEAIQTIGASQSDFIKRLASNLGYATSQTNVGSAIGRIQGMAKSADEKVIDSKFEALQSFANRENQKAQAMQQAIVGAISIAATMGAKGMMSKFKLSKKQFIKNSGTNNKVNKQFVSSLQNFITATLKSILTSAFMAEQFKSLEKGQEKRARKMKKKRASELGEIADEATSSRGGELSGLEMRGMSAQFLSGSTQESQAMVEQLKRLADIIAQPLLDMYQAAASMIKLKFDSDLKGSLKSKLKDKMKARKDKINKGEKPGSATSDILSALGAMMPKQTFAFLRHMMRGFARRINMVSIPAIMFRNFQSGFVRGISEFGNKMNRLNNALDVTQKDTDFSEGFKKELGSGVGNIDQFTFVLFVGAALIKQGAVVVGSMIKQAPMYLFKTIDSIKKKFNFKNPYIQSPFSNENIGLDGEGNKLSTDVLEKKLVDRIDNGELSMRQLNAIKSDLDHGNNIFATPDITIRVANAIEKRKGGLGAKIFGNRGKKIGEAMNLGINLLTGRNSEGEDLFGATGAFVKFFQNEDNNMLAKLGKLGVALVVLPAAVLVSLPGSLLRKAFDGVMEDTGSLGTDSYVNFQDHHRHEFAKKFEAFTSNSKAESLQNALEGNGDATEANVVFNATEASLLHAALLYESTFNYQHEFDTIVNALAKANDEGFNAISNIKKIDNNFNEVGSGMGDIIEAMSDDRFSTFMQSGGGRYVADEAKVNKSVMFKMLQYANTDAPDKMADGFPSFASDLNEALSQQSKKDGQFAESYNYSNEEDNPLFGDSQAAKIRKEEDKLLDKHLAVVKSTEDKSVLDGENLTPVGKSIALLAEWHVQNSKKIKEGIDDKREHKISNKFSFMSPFEQDAQMAADKFKEVQSGYNKRLADIQVMVNTLSPEDRKNMFDMHTVNLGENADKRTKLRDLYGISDAAPVTPPTRPDGVGVDVAPPAIESPAAGGAGADDASPAIESPAAGDAGADVAPPAASGGADAGDGGIIPPSAVEPPARAAGGEADADVEVTPSAFMESFGDIFDTFDAEEDAKEKAVEEVENKNEEPEPEDLRHNAQLGGLQIIDTKVLTSTKVGAIDATVGAQGGQGTISRISRLELSGAVSVDGVAGSKKPVNIRGVLVRVTGYKLKDGSEPLNSHGGRFLMTETELEKLKTEKGVENESDLTLTIDDLELLEELSKESLESFQTSKKEGYIKIAIEQHAATKIKNEGQVKLDAQSQIGIDDNYRENQAFFRLSDHVNQGGLLNDETIKTIKQEEKKGHNESYNNSVDKAFETALEFSRQAFHDSTIEMKGKYDSYEAGEVSFESLKEQAIDADNVFMEQEKAAIENKAATTLQSVVRRANANKEVKEMRADKEMRAVKVAIQQVNDNINIVDVPKEGTMKTADIQSQTETLTAMNQDIENIQTEIDDSKILKAAEKKELYVQLNKLKESHTEALTQLSNHTEKNIKEKQKHLGEITSTDGVTGGSEADIGSTKDPAIKQAWEFCQSIGETDGVFGAQIKAAHYLHHNNAFKDFNIKDIDYFKTFKEKLVGEGLGSSHGEALKNLNKFSPKEPEMSSESVEQPESEEAPNNLVGFVKEFENEIDKDSWLGHDRLKQLEFDYYINRQKE